MGGPPSNVTGERLAQHRKHPSSCEKAIHEKCECGHCAGTQHSWVGALHMVNNTSSEAFRDFERDANRRWDEHCNEYESKSRKPSKATLPHKKAAVDSARADVIGQLRSGANQGGQPHTLGTKARSGNDSQLSGTSTLEDPQHPHESTQQPSAESTSDDFHHGADLEFDRTATDRALATDTSDAVKVETLGYLLEQALKDVEEDVGPLRPETRKAMAQHFWCELLVQLIVVIEGSNRLLASVPDKVAKEITKSRREGRLARIQHTVIAASARQVCDRLTGALGLTAIGDAKALLPALRMLAVLMCKSPPRHTAVIKHGMDPLKKLLFHETKKRLRRVFSNLVPEITTDLGGDDPLTSTG